MRRITISSAAVFGVLVLMSGAAGTAVASSGPAIYASEQAGYAVTGAHFQNITTTFKLPDASQFAKNIGTMTDSVQLWSANYILVAGVTTCTSHNCMAGGRSSPGNKWVFTASVWVYSGNILHGLNFSVNFYREFSPGDTVTLSINYAHSTDQFHVDDQTTGVKWTATYSDPGDIFKQGRAGVEFSAPAAGQPVTPSSWGSPAGGFKAPSSETLLQAFSSTTLTTTSGLTHSLSYASWKHHIVYLTSGGGSIEAAPHGLGNSGHNFSVYLEPAV